mmetsp:Transcript_12844/g.36951  ORF Transcript_12844/g.36951 Transcript_12844/m.36951 type:complete len:189 (+) Transcript_12844:105-671(+)
MPRKNADAPSSLRIVDTAGTKPVYFGAAFAEVREHAAPRPASAARAPSADPAGAALEAPLDLGPGSASVREGLEEEHAVPAKSSYTEERRSCVCNRVLTTSNGCVAKEANAPLSPADKKYHGNSDPGSDGLELPEDDPRPKDNFNDSFEATRTPPKGTFIANVVGILRYKPPRPSRRTVARKQSPIPR